MKKALFFISLFGLSIAIISTAMAEMNLWDKLFSGNTSEIIDTFDHGSLTIYTGEKQHDFVIEIADEQKEVMQGLMYRKSMAENHGMLFIFPNESMLQFWMKNTYIPLDIIFLNHKKEIVHIHENAIPQDKTLIRTSVPAMYVLELNAGMTKKLQIKKGDAISYKNDSK